MQTDKTSVYLKIFDDVKRKISLGLLKEDERLPSCRDLAVKMGINPNTVQRAYSALEAEGYIYTQPKKGVYVAATDKKLYIEEVAREKLTELKRSGMDKATLNKLVDEIYGGSND